MVSVVSLILIIFFTQDSEFRLVFGRIEETIKCFRDYLTFNSKVTEIQRETKVFVFLVFSMKLTVCSCKRFQVNSLA